MTNLVSIIIPTLNEEENIADLIIEINKVFKKIDYDLEIIVVDDGSSDNTLAIIKKLANKYSNLKLIIRNEKGLTSAIIKGFKEAKGEIFCVMDADFSHHPKFIPDLIENLINHEADMVIASRYLKNSFIKRWPLKRKILSIIATKITRLITEIKDPLSGFFVIRKEVIENINLNPFNPKICLEIIIKGNFKNKIIEIPYQFEDRLRGRSKLLSLGTIKCFLIHFFYLILTQNNLAKRFIKFIIVGTLGTIINLLFFYLLVKHLSIWYILSAIISFFIAVTNNYLLNQKWTFAGSVQSSYLKFVLVSLGGLIVNLIILFLLVEYLRINYLLSQLIAIGLASIFNFYQSQRFVFKYSYS
ncbi:MAG: dolichol monophosphate mannose synthase [Candidatus Parcubacteria bacterium]|nr:MAG: dolichol monophosphate mannose synthase [Candidatus Parcubacteria bacterium]